MFFYSHIKRIMTISVLLFLIPISSMGNNLTKAIQECNLNKVKILIEQKNFDVNQANKNKVTPLHFASSLSDKNCSSTKIMEFLLKKGANPNAQTIDGYTPLHITAYNGYYKLSKILIQNGASTSIDTPNNSGSIPLHQLLRGKNIKNIHIQLLVEKGNYGIVHTIDREDKHKIRPIHLIVGRLNTKGEPLENELNYLIGKKVNINAKTVDGITPLEIAIRKTNKSDKYISYIKILLKHGAIIDKKDIVLAKNKEVQKLLTK